MRKSRPLSEKFSGYMRAARVLKKSLQNSTGGRFPPKTRAVGGTARWEECCVAQLTMSAVN